MVYEKKRSGDPDYDEKVPPPEHGRIMTAEDGTKYLVTEAQGPVTLDGQHFDPDAHDLSDVPGDNRPAPGEVATEASTVQQYDPAAAPQGVPKDPPPADDTVPMTPDETPASTPGAPGKTPNKVQRTQSK